MTHIGKVMLATASTDLVSDVIIHKLMKIHVAVSCGYDTWFAVRLVMDYTYKTHVCNN